MTRPTAASAPPRGHHAAYRSHRCGSDRSDTLASIDGPTLSQRPVEQRADVVATLRHLGRVGDEHVDRRERGRSPSGCAPSVGRFSAASTWSSTTSRSMSESGPSSPRATEPKRITSSGSTAATTSSTTAGHSSWSVLPSYRPSASTWCCTGMGKAYGSLRTGRPAIEDTLASATGPGHRVERNRDRVVAFAGGVLVQQRRPRRAVADAGHQLLGARPGRGGERVAGVAQVVEVEVLTPDRRGHRLPLRVPVAAQQRRALRPGEHDRVGPWLDEAPEVVDQLVDHERGQAHHPSPSVGLRRSEHALATGELERLLDHVHRAGGEIDALGG